MEAPHDPNAPFVGKLNIYTCQKCREHIVTQDLEPGVTPFSLPCRATPHCKGWMQSSMYRVFDQSMKPAFVWYRPPATQRLTKGEAEHVNKGGLLLRKAPT